MKLKYILVLSALVFLNPITVWCQALLNEQFRDLTDWNYSALESNKGSEFSTSDGILTVLNFGKEQGGWYGPVIEKDLSRPINLDKENFRIDVFMTSLDDANDAYGVIEVSLLSTDNLPLVTVAWCDGGGSALGTCPCQKALEGKLYTWQGGGVIGFKIMDNWFYDRGSFNTVNGILSIKKSSGQFTAHFNKGKPLAAISMVTSEKASKVKVRVLRHSSSIAREMKIDYIKIEYLK